MKIIVESEDCTRLHKFLLTVDLTEVDPEIKNS